MCPPPSDPIWPIGPTLGQVYVPRADQLQPAHRRRRREDDASDGRRHAPHADDASEETSSAREDDQQDPGTYDDHGRATHREDEEPAVHRHVDAVA